MKGLSIKKFLLVTLLAALVSAQLYRRSTIPPGLSNDETNIGYDAWSIAMTGRDQWGRVLPITFEGFGNWSLPVYIYFLAPFLAVFGPTVAAVRALSFFVWVGLMIATFFLVRILEPKLSSLQIAAPIMVGITPWIFSLTRTATEVPLATLFFTISILLFFHKPQSGKMLILSAFFSMLALLTYYGMWVFLPLFWGYVLWKLRQEIHLNRNVIKPILLIIIITVIAIVCISTVQHGNSRLSQVNVTTDPALVGGLNDRRGVCSSMYSSLLCRIIYNKPILYGSQLARNYLAHFSIREWFLTNSNNGLLPPGGFFLSIQAPLFFLGLWEIFRRGSRMEQVTLGSWLFLSPLGDSITGEGNFTRAFLMAPAIAIISSYGLCYLKRLGRIIISLVLVASGVSFFITYVSFFPVFHSYYTHYEYQPLMAALSQEKNIPVFLSSRVRDTKQYIFYLFYQAVRPSDFQRNLRVVREQDEGGWIWVKQIGQWNFVKSIPIPNDLPDELLLIGAPKEEIQPFVADFGLCDTQASKRETIIPYLNGDAAFSIVHLRRVNQVFCIDTPI